LLPALASRGLEIVAWMSPEQAERFSIPGIQAMAVADAPPMSIRGHGPLLGAIAREGCDLVHFPHLDVPLRMRSPHVVTIHDLIPLRVADPTRPAWKRLAFGVMARLAPRNARLIMTVSEHTRQDLERLLNVAHSRIVVTPPGVDPRFFDPVPDRQIETVRARFALPGPFVLYVGQTKPHKNLEMLISAFMALEGPGHEAVSLVLAGAPDPRSGLEKHIRERGAHARVTMLGRVSEDELHALLASATCLAFPSRYEGFGLPPLEAMAHGTPVISSDASSLPEVVGDAALLLAPEAVLEWRDALDRVFGDASLRETLRVRGRARALHFSWDETARLTIEGYHRALGRPPAV
jgi:glycosyltransferase involved in cell wall biosynthesis